MTPKARSLLFFLLAFLSPGALWSAPEQAPFRIGWTPIPPHSFEQDGIITGFDISLWRYVAERVGFPYVLEEQPNFKVLLERLRRHELDAGLGALNVAPERMQDMAFSLPISQSYYTVFVKETPHLLPNILRIATSADAATIYVGFLLLLVLFTLPVWLWERSQRKLPIQGLVQELLYFGQKTMLLSTDHTTRTRSRIISILSVFPRVLLTSLFVAYVVNGVYQLDLADPTQSINDMSDLRGLKVGVMESDLIHNILSERGITAQTCEVLHDCLVSLVTGEMTAVVAMPHLVYWERSTDLSMAHVERGAPLFFPQMQAFAISSQSPLMELLPEINRVIALSYRNGVYDRLHARWITIE